MDWNPERWEQFHKVVEFLLSHNAQFVTVSDFAKSFAREAKGISGNLLERRSLW